VQGKNFYTVEQAARALKLTPDRIHQMLRDGELEGVPPQVGDASAWKIPIKVIHGRDRPPPMDFFESFTADPERPPEPEDISGFSDTSAEEEPNPTTPRLQSDEAAEKSGEPTTAPSTHQVTAEQAARILKKSTDALLLEAKDEVIEDLRDRVAFLEQQLESRAEEIRRRDHIIAALTERIPPAIEAPNREKSPTAHKSTAEEPAGVAPTGTGGPESGSKPPRDTAESPVGASLFRPWWKRVIRR